MPSYHKNVIAFLKYKMQIITIVTINNNNNNNNKKETN